MATLEKIRSKSVFLLVIIGLALLAFILTDFLNSGRSLFGTGTTIATVDGHKIDVQELQKRMSEQQNQPGADADMLQAQTLNQMIYEALYEQELADLGIVVTDKELSDFINGEGSAILDMRFQQMGLGSAKQFYQMLANPASFGLNNEQSTQLTQIAQQIENEVEEQLKMMKFATLFNGTLVANELDAKAFYADNNTTQHILFAKKDYSSLPDDKFTVTDEEIQAEYNRTRNAYRLAEESRTVNYIAVNIVPSPADIQAGQKRVEDAIAALRGAEGSTGLTDNNFLISNHKDAASKIDEKTRAFLQSDSVGSVQLVSTVGTDYTIVKKLGQAQQVDSVLVDFIAMQSKEQFDSLLNGLRNGTIALSSLQDSETLMVRDSVWESALNPQMAPTVLSKDVLSTAATGVFFNPDTTATNPQFYSIARIRNRKAEVPVYEYITAEYTLTPSAGTVNNLYSELAKFVADNNNAKAFAENAAKAGYQVVPVVVTPSSISIGAVKDSRPGVRWVMKEGKKGQVSPVKGGEQTGVYYAVAINDVYDGDFVPVSDPDVRARITSKLMADKKAAELIKTYSGKASDIAGMAQAMGVSADTTTVTFGQPIIAKLGPDGRVAAAVSTAPTGKLMGPVQGSNGVVAFVVTEVEQPARAFNYADDAAAYERVLGGQALGNNMFGILLGRKKIKNNSLTFYGSEN